MSPRQAAAGVAGTNLSVYPSWPGLSGTASGRPLVTANSQRLIESSLHSSPFWWPSTSPLLPPGPLRGVLRPDLTFPLVGPCRQPFLYDGTGLPSMLAKGLARVVEKTRALFSAIEAALGFALGANRHPRSGDPDVDLLRQCRAPFLAQAAHRGGGSTLGGMIDPAASSGRDGRKPQRRRQGRGGGWAPVHTVL
jgi:hypothetical protein